MGLKQNFCFFDEYDNQAKTSMFQKIYYPFRYEPSPLNTLNNNDLIT